MFRPPKSRPTLDDLPDELWLCIAAQFTHLSRNGDLASLALVSKRWRPIAQEWLLKEPCFKLTHIDKYLWEIGHRDHLLPQIRTLEIHSSSEGRIQRDTNGMPKREYTAVSSPAFPLWELKFVEKCQEVIAHLADDKRNERRWSNALAEDVVPALFGVLLCTLPNLRELILGDCWLMDMPIFASMVSPDINGASPHLWHHTYLNSVLATLLPKLEVLDVPADMSSLWFSSRAATIFDFRGFQSLRKVGITMKALWWCPRMYRSPPDPRELFPPTLEVLKISEATEYTPMFLSNLCTAKKGRHFPKLRRVEVYYMEDLQAMKDSVSYLRYPNAVDFVQQMFRDAELGLYVFFPEWQSRTWELGGSPWILKKESFAFETARRRMLTKATGPFGIPIPVSDVFEAEWDVDGDSIMRQ
ncbi:hypothetical protein CC86DRAFT_385050 [Ophiobolus disseminans]|uniref:F-box domain-containing protein n=1 Tax=Ophiobolus disseminans TaxID=1469910 RepID=A0A6A6ZPZ7_9PLEO|nr:hypothetical protein CC86DRAFT_385050 [Ophiobolus disseminans]